MIIIYQPPVSSIYLYVQPITITCCFKPHISIISFLQLRRFPDYSFLFSIYLYIYLFTYYLPIYISPFICLPIHLLVLSIIIYSSSIYHSFIIHSSSNDLIHIYFVHTQTSHPVHLLNRFPHLIYINYLSKTKIYSFIITYTNLHQNTNHQSQPFDFDSFIYLILSLSPLLVSPYAQHFLLYLLDLLYLSYLLLFLHSSYIYAFYLNV